MHKVAEVPADGGNEAPLAGTGRETMASLFSTSVTDLYHSGTKHEEDQPSHLIIHDTNVCNERCVKEYGSPLPEFLSRERIRNGGLTPPSRTASASA